MQNTCSIKSHRIETDVNAIEHCPEVMNCENFPGGINFRNNTWEMNCQNVPGGMNFQSLQGGIKIEELNKELKIQ